MPTVWKSASITPVRKGDNRELVENYKCQRETPLPDGRRRVVLAIIINPLPQKNGNSTIWWPTPTRSWDYGRAVETIQRRSGPSPPRTSLVHGYGQLDLQMVSRSSRTSHRAFPGQVKKELNDEDAIVEFATAGPKTYGFRTHLGTLECKVHGFRLNIPANNNWISTSSNRTSSRKASDLKTSQLILYLLI